MRQWLWVGIGALVVVFALQTWAIVSLRGEVSELRDEVSRLGVDEAPERGGDDGSVTRETSEDPVARRRAAKPTDVERRAALRRASQQLSAAAVPRHLDSDQAALDESVERSLDRVERARFEDKAEQWTQQASNHINTVVDEFVAEGRIPGETRDDVTDLLLNSLYETWQLKADVTSGEMNEQDAIARYKQRQGGVADSLTDLVGEETATDLLAAANGK